MVVNTLVSDGWVIDLKGEAKPSTDENKPIVPGPVLEERVPMARLFRLTVYPASTVKPNCTYSLELGAAAVPSKPEELKEFVAADAFNPVPRVMSKPVILDAVLVGAWLDWLPVAPVKLYVTIFMALAD